MSRTPPIDPMRGNSVAAGGFKTRFLGDIVAEMKVFFDNTDSQRLHADLDLAADAARLMRRRTRPASHVA